jgi:hypothetical protein
MPGGVTEEDFAKCVNQTCQVHHGSDRLEMQLVECRKLSVPGRSGGLRVPFALLFRGPKTPVLPQRMYQFDFEPLGAVEIFIVPVGPDEAGMRYEAIFT